MHDIAELIGSEMSLTDEQKAIVRRLIPVRSFAKGDELLKEGDSVVEGYFLLDGLVRMYRLVEGEERNLEFYKEGDAITSMEGYHRFSKATHYLQCLEDSTLAVLEKDSEDELYKAVPALESLCRVSMEDSFGALQSRLESILSKSAEERYLEMLSNQKELLQRIPQYHLASYLGIKPESLSRIRKRLVEKG